MNQRFMGYGTGRGPPSNYRSYNNYIQFRLHIDCPERKLLCLFGAGGVLHSVLKSINVDNLNIKTINFSLSSFYLNPIVHGFTCIRYLCTLNSTVL